MRSESLLAPSSSSAPYLPDVLVGLYTFNGSGIASLNADENAGGTAGALTPDTALSATYVSAASGRTTVTPSSGDNAVLYIVSPTKAVELDLVTAYPAVDELQH